MFVDKHIHIPVCQSPLSRPSGDTEGEKAALQVRVDSVEQELEEEGLRVQELLQQNAQLEMERERK